MSLVPIDGNSTIIKYKIVIDKNTNLNEWVMR